MGTVIPAVKHRSIIVKALKSGPIFLASSPIIMGMDASILGLVIPAHSSTSRGRYRYGSRRRSRSTFRHDLPLVDIGGELAGKFEGAGESVVGISISSWLNLSFDDTRHHPQDIGEAV